ncbi:MAG: protein phosphatase 2C domain-containing protein [Prevotella sp.]|nr:protein phosphatase 2C domain-containing protein [Prevotella sp.]
MRRFFQLLSIPFKRSMINDGLISVSFMTEKIVGHGEDAPPILMAKGQSYAVGVFDGMGGAGAATCKSDYGEGLTKAYVASRITASSVELYLSNHLNTEDVSTEDLKQIIMQRLKEEIQKYPPQTKSILRSKLVRDYPTTMALVVLTKGNDNISIDSYWAGDSHCYLWTLKGFFQISKDDLEEKNDPMENLHNDSPISNCICADRDFTINHQHIELPKEPTIILVASDGCFGYYPTPMHFEYVLSSTLQKANNEKDWECLIKENIMKVTGDDCSFSLIAIGFSSFEDFKKSMKAYKVEGFPILLEQEETIAYFEKELAKEKEMYEQNVTARWEKYKSNYMKFIND